MKMMKKMEVMNMIMKSKIFSIDPRHKAIMMTLHINPMRTIKSESPSPMSNSGIMISQLVD